MADLREPPRGPPDEPVRPLVTATCPICLGDRFLDDGYLYDSDESNVRPCTWCYGLGYVLVEQKRG